MQKINAHSVSGQRVKQINYMFTVTQSENFSIKICIQVHFYVTCFYFENKMEVKSFFSYISFIVGVSVMGAWLHQTQSGA